MHHVICKTFIVKDTYIFSCLKTSYNDENFHYDLPLVFSLSVLTISDLIEITPSIFKLNGE